MVIFHSYVKLPEGMVKLYPHHHQDRELGWNWSFSCSYEYISVMSYHPSKFCGDHFPSYLLVLLSVKLPRHRRRSRRHRQPHLPRRCGWWRIQMNYSQPPKRIEKDTSLEMKIIHLSAFVWVYIYTLYIYIMYYIIYILYYMHVGMNIQNYQLF